MGHKTQLYLNEPGRRRGGSRGRRRGPVCRGSRASGIRQKGAALNITALVFCPGSTPSCQLRRVADLQTLPGLLDSFPAQSRQREASESDSSTAERSARAATRWVHGPRSADPHAAWRRSVRPPCGGPPSVRSAIVPGGETERQRSVASGKWPCSRLLPMFWPGEASRPTTVSSATGGASRRIAVSCPCEASRAIAVLAGRSLAAILLFGHARAVLTVSAVCGRRNEGA